MSRDNDDADMTREPEMVKAYRDTWELGLHSYLTYLRDRLYVARELLTPSGSVFVQIGDENVHHVRELLDELFGEDNFVAEIAFAKTSSLSSPMARTLTIPVVTDLILWYARDRERIKYRQLYRGKETGRSHDAVFRHVELSNGTRRPITADEAADPRLLPAGSRLYALGDLTSQLGVRYDITFGGRTFSPRRRGWRTHEHGMARLIEARRVQAVENSLRYVSFEADFPVMPLTNLWDDTGTGSFLADRLYVVQTAVKAVERCLLMTTDPGDLVLDPTCGSGTTAYVAEQWGRRWITIDTSRVPLALARQRLLTATFPYYELQDPGRGPGGGFVYKRKQDRKGEEVGGIVPHVTLKSIANEEPPAEEVLVDRPEVDSKITRVTGPFVVEATIPTPVDFEGDGVEDSGVTEDASYLDRMLEALRRNPSLQMGGNKAVTPSQRSPTRPVAVALRRGGART